MKNIFNTILFLGVSFMGFSQVTEDEGAIRSVCEKETRSWNNRDAEGMIECHANKPYSLKLVVERGNVHYITTKSGENSEKLIKVLITMMGPPNGDLFLNYGYVIHINGTSAFVYYDQKVKSIEGKETNFHEVRNLEKIDGNWKIIYIGAVEFKPQGN